MADEQADLAELVELLERTVRWQERTGVDPNASAVDPGSALAGDDRRTDPHHLSHAAWHALTISADHLHCLKSAIAGDQGHAPKSVRLHIYGPFTLLRGGLENAATAVWLLSPAQRNERILRRLRLAAANIKHSEEIGRLIGAQAKRTRDERLGELRRIARTCVVDENRALKGPGYEEVVRSAGEATFQDGDLAVVLWKGCSGLAHGDIWATLSMLDREVNPHPSGLNVLSARITAPTAALVAVLKHTVFMLDRGFALFDRGARRQY